MAPAEGKEKKIKKPLGFRIFGGTFTFRLWATLIALLMMAALMALGCWQIERLHWKTDYIEMMQSRLQERSVDLDLSVIPSEGVSKMDYHPGRASGAFDNAKEMYLHAISINGDSGYDVLTPLKLDDGRVLLVNRGWMPYRLKDKPKGDEPHESLHRPKGTVHVQGILRLPPEKQPPMRPNNNTGNNEWYWIDINAMAGFAGVKEFLPYYLDADDAPHQGAWPVGGQTRMDIPNHHLHYAIFWFWLAGILPFIYFTSNWRLNRPAKPAAAEKPADDKPTEDKPA